MTDAAVIERLRKAPRVAHWIVRTLEEHGFETWAVGGAVRDTALGFSVEDWDFATQARPADVQRLFRRTVAVGADHGTIGVLAKDRRLYEVTTFRRDVKPLGRRAVVEFADTLGEDLARRDFTFNALAWHPFREQLVDPFDGLDDLGRGVLRTVGDPTERFREDRLRVLRGLRFAARFRLAATADTWAAMVASVPDLGVLSAERIREELMKSLTGVEQPSSALALYAASGVLAELFPELARLLDMPLDGGAVTRWERALLVADALPGTEPLLRLAGLLAEVVEEGGPRDVAQMLVRLRFSGAETERAMRWAECQPSIPGVGAGGPERRRWLAGVEPAARRGALRLTLARARANRLMRGVDHDGAVTSVRALRREARARPPLSVAALAVDGRDVMRLGLRPGPRVGEVLRSLLDSVLEDPAENEREALLARAADLIRGEGDG